MLETLHEGCMGTAVRPHVRTRMDFMAPFAKNAALPHGQQRAMWQCVHVCAMCMCIAFMFALHGASRDYAPCGGISGVQMCCMKNVHCPRCIAWGFTPTVTRHRHRAADRTCVVLCRVCGLLHGQDHYGGTHAQAWTHAQTWTRAQVWTHTRPALLCVQAQLHAGQGRFSDGPAAVQLHTGAGRISERGVLKKRSMVLGFTSPPYMQMCHNFSHVPSGGAGT